MNDFLDEFDHQVATWRKAGDTARLRMVELYHESYRYRETDPERRLGLLTQARAAAQGFNEPWWVLFFDYYRLATLTADLHDFARALPLAVELLVRFTGTEGQGHPFRELAVTSALYAYLQTDPIGYQAELEDGFAYLDGQVSPGPSTTRYVLDYRRAEFLRETERWEESLTLSRQSLAETERNRDQWSRDWGAAWILFNLCEVCNALGRFDQLAAYAEDMWNRSEQRHDLLRTQATAAAWLAGCRRRAGDEQMALRWSHRCLRQLEALESRDEICADALARYHEVGGDLQAALGVRDRELAVVTRKGMLHRACRVEIERCRLLSCTGTLDTAAVGRAREAAAKMRVPQWHLERLARVIDAR